MGPGSPSPSIQSPSTVVLESPSPLTRIHPHRGTRVDATVGLESPHPRPGVAPTLDPGQVVPSTMGTVSSQGMVDTAKKNFGGGNTAWEEKTLSKYESRWVPWSTPVGLGLALSWEAVSCLWCLC